MSVFVLNFFVSNFVVIKFVIFYFSDMPLFSFLCLLLFCLLHAFFEKILLQSAIASVAGTAAGEIIAEGEIAADREIAAKGDIPEPTFSHEELQKKLQELGSRLHNVEMQMRLRKHADDGCSVVGIILNRISVQRKAVQVWQSLKQGLK